MKILFIDTETTSLTPASGQIIEIAGVLADLDPVSLKLSEVDQYTSLVALRGEMDEKITRITGITAGDLVEAKPLHFVQEQWAKWLESNDVETIQAVVGHSVDFDLAFLKEESWLLPGSTAIDTLCLSKILLPELSAVNLEFLVEKLSLESEILMGQSSQSKMLAHRALYDTRASFYLLQRLMDKLIQIPAENFFYEALKSRFLPLPITLYSSNKIDTNVLGVNVVDEEVFRVKFNAQPEPTSIPKLITHNLRGDLGSRFELLVRNNLSENLLLITLQMYVIYILKQRKPDYEYKFHARSSLDYVSCKLILQALQLNFDSHKHPNNQAFLNHPIENILTQISELHDTTLNLGVIIDLLEFYLQVHGDEELTGASKLISSYDFLIIALQPFWEHNEQIIDLRQIPYQKEALGRKWKEFSVLLDDVLNQLSEQRLDNDSIGLVEACQTELAQQKLIWQKIDQTRPIKFSLVKNSVSLSQPKPDFDLNLATQQAWQGFEKMEVNTFLSDADLKNLCAIINWSVLEFPNLDIQELGGFQDGDLQTYENLSLLEFYKDQIELSKSQSHPSIILCGQNSSLRDSQKILTSEFAVKDYLLLGESGSLTKIASKLVRGFSGVLVCKVGDFNYLRHLKDFPELNGIWILSEPYFYLHQYWRNLSYAVSQDPKDFQKQLKRFYLLSQAAQIKYHTGYTPKFVRSYNV